jgi:tripartite-type tricarboxylate transporter receptor subunit TctC
VPNTPGGTVDLLARTLGQKLTAAWGQPVVTVNRAGAGVKVEGAH